MFLKDKICLRVETKDAGRGWNQRSPEGISIQPEIARISQQNRKYLINPIYKGEILKIYNMAKTKAKIQRRGKVQKRTKKINKGQKRKRTTKPRQSRKGKGRRFYNVGEDSQILKLLGGKATDTAVSVMMGQKLDRNSESVRDRIKRYLKKLSSVDQKSVIAHAKKNSGDYIFFKTQGNGKRVDKFSKLPPTLQNQQGKRKPKKKKAKKVSKKSMKIDNFAWFKEKIYNKDPYFALEHQVQFLSDLFNHLIQHHSVKEAEIRQFIDNTNTECTLEQILQTFDVRL